ncbi:MAG: hypothetical protein K0S65_962 [Labilithrix sp.]|nr:hypothetical protein [Labilithrix sp.]
MSEIKRLLEQPVSPGMEALLRSAKTDGPTSASAEERALAVMGLLPPATAARPSTKTRPIVSVVQAAGVSALLAGLAVVGFVVTRPSAPASLDVRPQERPLTTESAAETAAPLATSISSTPSPALRVEDLPRAPETAGARALEPAPMKRTGPAPVDSSEAQLEDELAAIDAARAALSSGRGDTALARARHYQGSFPDGRFVEEADALEIQALAFSGRREEARSKGERFLAARPGSPYARRVRSSIGDSETKP